MSSPRQINLADTVMQRIERGGVKVRSRRYFTLRKVAFGAFLALLIAIAGFFLLSLGYVLRNDIFTSYLSAPSGTLLFLKSLPWAGVAGTAMLLIATVFTALKLRKEMPKFRMSQAFASLAVFVLIVTALGGVGMNNKTPKAFAMVAYLSQADPVEVTGKVTAVDGNKVTATLEDGTQKTVYVPNLPTGLSINDEVHVIGTEKDGIVTAKLFTVVVDNAYEVVAPVEKVVEKKTTKPKAEEPAPAKTTTTETKTEETSFTKSITITSKEQVSDTKYLIKWSSNFTLKEGFKIVWSLAPNPKYPTDSLHYYFDGTSATSGMGYVKNSDGLGTYYVRVCQYLGGSCGVYSNQITVKFE